ncbi:TKL protein kinase [Salpingoeca rosetta]|uniref:non-specific serine/threonine protein kinase n=1 Tax=Salpingoeca rosetta (strain ATCC 50818 / BSB-021) TaxID=946362 RepID=F2UKT0_SALR5|nr:TKL protein kinase [Salpingoeca rosetta]EGD77729.1 TKL protein kinase [Salpingoeca rosetta]|eukprot:XP_004990205.1 TKL protein kinase [Salpingoeca rosetta]
MPASKKLLLALFCLLLVVAAATAQHLSFPASVDKPSSPVVPQLPQFHAHREREAQADPGLRRLSQGEEPAHAIFDGICTENEAEDSPASPLSVLRVGCDRHARLCGRARHALARLSSANQAQGPKNARPGAEEEDGDWLVTPTPKAVKRAHDEELAALQDIVAAFCNPVLLNTRRTLQPDAGDGLRPRMDTSKESTADTDGNLNPVPGKGNGVADRQDWNHLHHQKHRRALNESTPSSSASTSHTTSATPATTTAATPAATPVTTTPATQARSRQPRGDTLECSLQRVVGDLCVLQSTLIDHPRLVLTVKDATKASEDLAVFNTSHNPIRILSETVATHHLILRGEDPAQNELSTDVVRTILELGNWSSVATITLQQLVTDTFFLSTLNPLTNLTAIEIKDSSVVQLNTSANGAPFARAPFLQSLTVSHSRLRHVAAETVFHDMDALTHVRLDNNQITIVDASMFAPLTKVEELVLLYNHLTSVHEDAFVSNAALKTLTLHGNDITELKPGLLQTLTQLRKLDIGGNPIQYLRDDFFLHQTQLRELNLTFLQLSTVSTDLLAHATNLRELSLFRGTLKTIEAEAFAGLTNLERLDLSRNELTELSSAWFGTGLRRLTRIEITENKIECINDSLLDSLPALEVLYLQANALTKLSHKLLSNHENLRIFDVSDNNVQAVEKGSFVNVPSLLHFSLANNRVEKFDLPDTLAQLKSLRLNGNPIKHVPNFERLVDLEELFFNNHHIKHLDISPLLALTNLTRLEVSPAPELMGKATISIGESVTVPPMLRFVDVRNVDVEQLATRLLSQRRTSGIMLESLGLGWPGMNESTVPLKAICGALAPSVSTLQLTGTSYTRLDLCPDRQFNNVLLQDNTMLREGAVFSPLQHLNLSGSTSLTQFEAPSVEVLDISKTQFPVSRGLCRAWGSRVVVARDWMNKDAQSQERTHSLLRRCLSFSDIELLDLSDNEWINSPKFIEAPTAYLTALASEGVQDLNFVNLDNSKAIPILQLANTAITCKLRVSARRTRLLSHLTALQDRTTYQFKCSCAGGYRNVDGKCKPRKDTVTIVLATLAAVLGVQGLAYAVHRAYRDHRRLRVDNALKEQLLEEKDAEVLALKAVWEIEFSELQLLRVVASGGFGEVWEGQWDAVHVAVKIPRQAILLLDDGASMQDFEKEVEFLQRTRHPNLVRFFGAGQQPGTGVPFLVIEFVQLGSLRQLLEDGGLAAALRHFNATDTQDSEHGLAQHDEADGCVFVRSLTLQSLKLRLAQDVASGMAFIHKLGQLHRDLKSGNVLVSTSLRAKITDFGTITQRITAKRVAPLRGQHHDDQKEVPGDVVYDRQLCTQTLSRVVNHTIAVGTPMYMAPEVLDGGKYDGKADVFSFGVLLWEIEMEHVPDLIEQEVGPNFAGPMMARLFTLLSQGKRLNFDAKGSTPTWYQSLAQECMAQYPSQRPTFAQIHPRLVSLATRSTSVTSSSNVASNQPM